MDKVKIRPGFKAKLENKSKPKGGGQPSLQVTENITPSHPIRPKTKSTKAGKASKAKNLNTLAKEVNEINADLIRKEMRRDPHVLVINKAQFTTLIKDHFSELKRAA